MYVNGNGKGARYNKTTGELKTNNSEIWLNIKIGFILQKKFIHESSMRKTGNVARNII